MDDDKKPLRILLVEDRFEDAELVIRALKEWAVPFSTKRVAGRATFLRELHEYRPQLVLSDYSLLDFDAMGVIALVHQHCPATPVIVVTGSLNEETAVACMKAGAVDYVLKEHLIRLVPAVTEVMNRLRTRQEKDKADKAAKSSEQRLELALQGADLGLWDWDLLSGKVVFNERWARMLGYELNELDPYVRVWQNLIHPDDRLLVLDSISAHLQGQTPHFEAEYRLLSKQGDWVWIMGRGKVVERDSQDSPTRMTGTHLDLTQKRNQEEHRAMLEEQLRQSQKMEAVGHLAAGVAHDFNNLLTPILGCAEFALEKMPPQDFTTGLFKQIQEAASRARNLSSQLLAFGRRQAMHMRPLELNEEIRSFEPILRRLIREDIRIELSLTAEKSWVNADPTQMQQVLMNLAVNAQESMAMEGELKITTETVPLSDSDRRMYGLESSGPYFMLVFSDTGVGMDVETLNRIFEPFFTTKGRQKGSGLGLSTVYGIVKQHGGHLRAKSHPGKGATFHIYLPLTDEKPQEKSEEPSLGSYRGKGETVLVAEDDALVRSLVTTVLTEYNYRVFEAPDARKALEIGFHDGDKLDILVTDVIMPGLNGRELYQELKTTHPDLRVLYLSGHPEDVIESHGVSGPDLHFLQKPFTVKDLAKSLRRALEPESHPSGA